MWRCWCWHWYLRGSWQGRWRSQPGWWSWGGRRWQWWRARRGSGRSDSPWAEQCWWAEANLGRISSTLIWMILMTRKVWCFWEFQPDGSIPFRVFPSEVGHAENGKPNWHLSREVSVTLLCLTTTHFVDTSTIFSLKYQVYTILHMVVVATKTAHPGGKSSELDQHEDVGRGQVDKREKSLQIRKWKWFNLKIEHRKWKW